MLSIYIEVGERQLEIWHYNCVAHAILCAKYSTKNSIYYFLVELKYIFQFINSL